MSDERSMLEGLCDANGIRYAANWKDETLRAALERAEVYIPSGEPVHEDDVPNLDPIGQATDDAPPANRDDKPDDAPPPPPEVQVTRQTARAPAPKGMVEVIVMAPSVHIEPKHLGRPWQVISEKKRFKERFHLDETVAQSLAARGQVEIL